jgi:hypothetical protein
MSNERRIGYNISVITKTNGTSSSGCSFFIFWRKNKMTDLSVLKSDNCTINFKEGQDMADFLNAMTSSDIWQKIPISGLNLKYVNDVNEVNSSGVTFADSDDITNHLQDGGYVLESHVGEFLVSEHAIPTLRDRASNNAQVMKRLSKSDTAKMLNMSWPYFTKDEGLALIRGNRVLAIHSGKNNGYVPINQGDLFSSTLRNLAEQFPDTKFHSGIFQHDLTFATFIVGDDEHEIMAAYKDAWIRAGYPSATLDGAYPAVQFGTSDTGTYCATLYPLLIVKNRIHRLGNSLAVKHHGSASLEKFEDLFPQIFARVKDSIAKMAELLTTEISYPIETAIRVSKELKLPKKAAKEAIQMYKEYYFGGPATAYEVYNALTEVLYSKHTIGLQGYSKLNLEESLARMIHLNWADHDGPGATELE